jgi:hypothetical protein
VSKDFDILDFTPSDTELMNGQSVLVADAGEFKRVTKINNETFTENLSLNDEDGESSNEGNDSTDTKTTSDLEFSNGNIIISSEESYFQVRDDSNVIRAQLGQVTTDNFGLKINKSSGGEIFGLYGSVANLCGWNIDESAISKVSGNDYVKLDTSSSQPRLEIAQNNVVRLKAGQLDSDKYGLKIWNASAEVLMEIADGAIAAETANIGGWDITSSSLKKGTDIVLDSTNKKISINSTTFGSDGVQIEHNSGNPRMYIGDGSNEFFKYDGTDITWKAANAELDATGKLIVTGATIGGWNVSANEISSSSNASHKRMFFSNTDNRIEVRNTSNAAVVAMGYLGGLAKTSGTGSWAATDYGFWIKAGDTAKIDGDVDYKDGAFLVESEGSFNIADATNTIVKLGTISNERGLFIGSDLDGTPAVKAKFTNGGFRIGAQSGGTDYMEYDTTNGLVIKGSITIENTIGASDLDSTIISGGKIITGLLTASNITTGTMDADRITAGTLDATQISALDMTGKSCTFNTGYIGGWTIDGDGIFRGTRVATGNYTGAAADMTIGAGYISAYKFRLDADGSAHFKGTIDAATTGALDGDVITINNLAAANISAGTITGSTLQTSASGQRVVIDGSNNQIDFYDASNLVMSLDANVMTVASSYGLIGSGTARPGLVFSNNGIVALSADNYIDGSRIRFQDGQSVFMQSSNATYIALDGVLWNDITSYTSASGAAVGGGTTGTGPVFAGYFKATHSGSGTPYALYVSDGYTKLEDVYVDGKVKQSGTENPLNYYAESTTAYPTLSLWDTSDSSYAQPALALITRGTNSNGTIPSGHDMGGIYFVNCTDHYGVGDWRGDKIRAMIDTYVTTNGYWSAGVDMQFWTAAGNGEKTKQMTLDEYGHLGIGTDPSYYLHVDKSVNDYVSFIKNSHSTGSGMIVRAGDTSSHRILRLDDKDGSAHFYFNSDGSSSPSGMSDESVKSDIAAYSGDALVDLAKLTPKTFKFNSQTWNTNLGFIAQDVESVIPSLIQYVSNPDEVEDQKKHLDYTGVTTMNTSAIMQLLAKIETLEAKVSNLENA